MEMMNLQLLQPFVVAIVLGAVIGFERTFASRMDHETPDYLGGIRTYSLVALFGSLMSFLGNNYAKELLYLGYSAIIIMTAVSYYIDFSKHNESGITTEVSMLICFTVGVIIERNQLVLALFITIITAVVLHMKSYLHRLADMVEQEDIRATLKFAIITFIILLFDPDFTILLREVGIFNGAVFDRFPGLGEVKVVNPYTVWLMVVLVSAIGFTGYIAIKILGQRKGIGLSGLLGGLASSTATTVAFSKRSRETGDAGSAYPYALAVILACSTMFPRVLLEVLIINPALLGKLIMVMGSMAGAGFLFCFVLWKKIGQGRGEEVPYKNPFNISLALKFAVVFAVIVFISRIAEVLFGNSGIYAISVLTGLSDVDPMTLTMSQISRDDPSKLDQATIAITLAAFANTFMKGAMAVILGSKNFKKIVIAGFGIILLTGTLVLIAVSVI
ncbi:MAG: MgtC/SapB family protein [Spirochaetes bacterium]|nr:MgtC/SapB family protein [Spirochaetota bacterium]